MKRQISAGLILLLFFLAGCYDFDNPFDPESSSHTGSSGGSGDSDEDDKTWLAGWSYRKLARVNGSVDEDVTNYPIALTVYHGAGTDSEEDVYLSEQVQPDFDDLRFTSDDRVTLLDYWIQETEASVAAVVWVEIPSIAMGEQAAVYLYYGNPSASGKGNGANTFLLFDDFEGTGINGTKWGGDIADVGPPGWDAIDGAAFCADSDMVIYCKNSEDNVAALARFKLEADSDGILGSRGSDGGGDQLTRFDLYLDRNAAAIDERIVLRSLITGTPSTLDESLNTFSDNYFLVALDVRTEGALHLLESEVEASGGGISEMTASSTSSDHDSGCVSMATGPANAGTVYVDWIAVRPLVSNEPAFVTWTSEQTLLA